jgi:hypothetical protein
MKRRVPLTRRTPLRRKTRLRQISEKRLRSDYYDRRWEFLLARPLCEVCSRRRSRQVHHRLPRGRYPEYLLDVDTWLAVCRPCHLRITDNPQWAREQGLLWDVRCGVVIKKQPG